MFYITDDVCTSCVFLFFFFQIPNLICYYSAKEKKKTLPQSLCKVIILGVYTGIEGLILLTKLES